MPKEAAFFLYSFLNSSYKNILTAFPAEELQYSLKILYLWKYITKYFGANESLTPFLQDIILKLQDFEEISSELYLKEEKQVIEHFNSIFKFELSTEPEENIRVVEIESDEDDLPGLITKNIEEKKGITLTQENIDQALEDEKAINAFSTSQTYSVTNQNTINYLSGEMQNISKEDSNI